MIVVALDDKYKIFPAKPMLETSRGSWLRITTPRDVDFALSLTRGGLDFGFAVKIQNRELRSEIPEIYVFIAFGGVSHVIVRMDYDDRQSGRALRRGRMTIGYLNASPYENVVDEIATLGSSLGIELDPDDLEPEDLSRGAGSRLEPCHFNTDWVTRLSAREAHIVRVGLRHWLRLQRARRRASDFTLVDVIRDDLIGRTVVDEHAATPDSAEIVPIGVRKRERPFADDAKSPERVRIATSMRALARLESHFLGLAFGLGAAEVARGTPSRTRETHTSGLA